MTFEQAFNTWITHERIVHEMRGDKSKINLEIASKIAHNIMDLTKEYESIEVDGVEALEKRFQLKHIIKQEVKSFHNIMQNLGIAHYMTKFIPMID